jgi:hypothetical protein
MSELPREVMLVILEFPNVAVPVGKGTPGDQFGGSCQRFEAALVDQVASPGAAFASAAVK